MKLKNLYKLFIIVLSFFFNSYAQEKILDSFESIQDWKIYKSEGVDVKISSVKGVSGKAVKMDYNFINGAGYGGIQKFIPVTYPENYQFSFYIKAESPANNLEFKLIDKSGDNVWWVNNRNYDFPNGWKKIVIKKRKIAFAWGPVHDKSLKQTDRIEFTIVSYVGGKGSVLIDDLRYEQLPPVSNEPVTPDFISSLNNNSISLLNDKNTNTFWTGENKEKILIDLKGMKEIGGVKINWENRAANFSLSSSNDNIKFEKLLQVNNNLVDKSILYLPETETKYLLLEFEKSSGASINEFEILPVDFSSSLNRFFINKAKDYPLGFFPRYLSEQKSYWTVIGWVGSEKEALMNEDGMIEVDKKNFSIEPFLFINNKLGNSHTASVTHKLEKNYLPVPSVIWDFEGVTLETKSFAYGKNNNSSLHAIYSIRNTTNEVKSGKFFLALRPFQVNPYYQELNMTGGFAKITSLLKSGENTLSVNDKKIYFSEKPEKFFASDINSGDVIEQINNGTLIPNNGVKENESGFTSGAVEYSFNLKPGESVDYSITVPFEGKEKINFTTKTVKENLSKAITYWEEKLNRVEFNVPKDAQKIVNTIKSNLAYVLINRDNVGIQPGSRSYERSWIRDGALTSSALMKMGIVDEVKEFINWYSKFQQPDGKIPCVVDKRGADPVPENDSHGEFIYLIKQYFNFTKDTLLLKEKYNNVVMAVNYIEKLMNERMTDYYKFGNDSLKSLYGLLPESISHEGYSEKPRHSYWDDFFAMKGLKDAVDIAVALNREVDVQRFIRLRDTFKVNLYNSINLAIKNTKIDYIPGCAELGDFDATSTTISINPCGEIDNLPQPYLNNTFEKYYQFFVNRKDPDTKWNGYTPYENRVIGSFIYLNQPERAHELIEYFLHDNRPYEWNQWAEVVWQDYRLPRFIGDMPHTWVGSDFINSCRALFVYEDEASHSLIIGAGIKKEWINSDEELSIKNFPTYYGKISYSIKKENNLINLSISGNDFVIPANGIIIKNIGKNDITIKSLPAELKIED